MHYPRSNLFPKSTAVQTFERSNPPHLLDVRRIMTPCIITPCITLLAQGEAFSTSGVSDANAAARVKGDGDSLYAKSATATYPYTYPAASALALVSASDT